MNRSGKIIGRMAGMAGLMAGAAVLIAQSSGPKPDAAGKPQGRLALGEMAPEIAATTLEGKAVALAGMHGEGTPGPAATPSKMIVLQFGSITEPIFRTHAAATEKLAAKYADKATFIILYQQEAHAADTDAALQLNNDEGFNIAQPTSLAERTLLAGQMGERLGIKNQRVVVDAWNNTSSLRYGSYPNMTFIIDGKGILRAGYPWMDPATVQKALDALVAGKELSADLQGSVKLSAAAPLDAAAAAAEMTGGRGPANIATALDKMNLTQEQRAALYPALADFLINLQDFRGARNNLPAAARAGATPPRAGGQPAPPAGAGGTASTKASTPADVQSAESKLVASAAKLKALIKQDLNAQDAKEMFAALEQMQAQKLFVNP